MKKTVNNIFMVLILGGICLSARHVVAQTSVLQTSRSNLKLSVVDLIQGHYELSFEQKVDQGNASFQITPGLYYRNGEVDRVLGYQLEWQYRKYFADWITNVPTIVWYLGFYHVGIRWSAEHDHLILDPPSNTYTTQTQNKSIAVSEGGGLLGAQILINKRIITDLQIGVGVRFSKVNTDQVGDMRDFSHRPSFEPGLCPSWNIQIGYLL